MNRLIKDPLTHFLVLGAVIFAVYPVFDERGAPEPDADTIVVDEAALLRFIQFRSRAFNEEHFREQLASMPADELQLLIDDYVREEVLFREATKLGLDEDDYIIRRRLVQKMEFLSDTSARTDAEISDDELQAYFAANRDRYYAEPHVTFTHVFFDADRRGWKDAEQLAQEASREFAANPPAFDESIEHGDRFPFHLNYVERVPELVAAHFGENASQTIFALEPGTWHGPIRSTFGYHLVLVSGRAEGRFPALEEVADRVREDAIAKRKNAILADGIADVVDTYDVRIEYARDPGQPS